MTIGCNIWMICLKLNWFFYGLSRMLQFSEFVWALSYMVWDVFDNFLLIDATDRSKLNSDQKRLFFAVSLYPFYFSRTLSKKNNQTKVFWLFLEITSVSNLSKMYIINVYSNDLTLNFQMLFGELIVFFPTKKVFKYHNH